MSDESQISIWLERLQQGDERDLDRLWQAYYPQLVAYARRKLGTTPRRIADEEDVALSAFDSMCQGMRAERFQQVSNRNELWRLLLAITHMKIADLRRRALRQKRGGGKTRGESVFLNAEDLAQAGLDQFADDRHGGEFVAELNEQYELLSSKLRDDSLRQLVAWKLEGYTNDEIAERLEISTRSVERKLRLIREQWLREFAAEL